MGSQEGMWSLFFQWYLLWLRPLHTVKNHCTPITGGGQKLHIGSLVLPVADNILSGCILPLFCLLLGLKFVPPLGQISSKTETKYIHLKMLSTTGRTRLLVRSFCPPPGISLQGVNSDSLPVISGGKPSKTSK